MSLKNISAEPRLTRALIAEGLFVDKQMTVIDVGARGGFDQVWNEYQNQVKLIGFEADVSECNRLNAEKTSSGHRYFPFAIHRDRGTRVFNIAAYRSSSGFFPADMDLLKRFPDQKNLTVVDSIMLNTIDLDTFTAENELQEVDFIKLDTEGAELDILEGAVETLKNTLGLCLEIWFQPWHTDQPLFRDIDRFLGSLGFKLFDVAVYRMNREALPEIPSSTEPRPTKWGQIISGDALYFRDGVAEITGNCLLKNGWDKISVFKLASLMEIFGLPDCVAEILITAGQQHILDERQVSRYLDFLVPKCKRSLVTYQQYLDQVAVATKRGHSTAIQGMKSRFTRILPATLRRMLYLGLRKLRNSINGIIGDEESR